MTTTQSRLALLSLAGAVALGLAFLLAPVMSRAQSATPAAISAGALIVEGEKTYNNLCIACHRPGGMGVKGIYPSLTGDALVELDDSYVIVSTVLNGRGGMPRFGEAFNDEQIAAIVSYVRSAWSNHAAAVTPDEVAAIRASFAVTPVSSSPVASAEPSLLEGTAAPSAAPTP